jgi:hypothetical protein
VVSTSNPIAVLVFEIGIATSDQLQLKLLTIFNCIQYTRVHWQKIPRGMGSVPLPEVRV